MTSIHRSSIAAIVASVVLLCIDARAAESLPALRLSASAGVNIPVGDYNTFGTAATYAVGVDLPISESGIFGGIGFASYSFNNEESMDGLAVAAFYAGLHFSLNSAADPVVAFISVNLGIDADTWKQAYILVGVGADFNLTNRLALFAEVTPTFPTPPSTLGWIPIRAGLRFLVPS